MIPPVPSQSLNPFLPPLVRNSHLAPTPARIPSRVPTNSQFAIDDSDPDFDPEWSLAPWGRRKDGKPRTEKEYCTILNRTICDVFGLDSAEGSAEDAEKSRPAPITGGATAHEPWQTVGN